MAAPLIIPSAVRRPETVDSWRDRLPHWQVEQGRYFVTMNLHGAIPPSAVNRVLQTAREFDRVHTNETTADRFLRINREIFRQFERWLERRPDATHFRDDDLAGMVLEAIEHRSRRRVWQVFDAVVMPNHVHWFFELHPERSLKRELHEFRRWTGHRASKIRPDIDATRFWQRDWFDHWSRSAAEDEKICRYIRRNPLRAGLATVVDDYPWFYRDHDRT